MALVARQPARGPLFHSDRGGAFPAWRVQHLAQEAGLVLSTSRPGRCLDHAVAESFFRTLKTELVYQHCCHTREEARLAVFEYIVAFYNRVRRHSSNGDRPPDEQEACYVANNP